MALVVQESGCQSSAAGHVMFTPQQSPMPQAMNTSPQGPPLKYLACTLEAFSGMARFPAIDIYNGAFGVGDIDLANLHYNDCRSYRTHTADFWAYDTTTPFPGPYQPDLPCHVVDTSDPTTFYPSQTKTGPFGNPIYGSVSGWYWADTRECLYAPWTSPYFGPSQGVSTLTTLQYPPTVAVETDLWSVSNEWDMTSTWNYMNTYLRGVDMAPCWTPLPAPVNARRVWTVNYFGGNQTDLSAVPPSTLPGSLGVYDGFLYLTSSTGTVTGTAAATGAAYPGNYAPGSGHPTTIDCNTGLHMPWSGPDSGNNGLVYSERVQAKFNLPVTICFVEQLAGFGRANQNYYKMRGIYLLPAETVIEVPQPTLFPGKPFIFQGPSTPLVATQATVMMLVNQTIQSWVALHDPTGIILTSYTGSTSAQVAPTADSTLVTADSTSYTADGA